MNNQDKKDFSEQDICEQFISPAIKNAGWKTSQIRREKTLTPGPIQVRGQLSSRNTAKKKYADYVLYSTDGIPVAVIEAKKNTFSLSHGLQQALDYANILQVPSAFSSNGDGFASHNKVPKKGEVIETAFDLDKFPSPSTLWQRYKIYHQIDNISEAGEQLICTPYHNDGSGKEPRYYQTEAINRTIEALAKGQQRILLVMATGTGKTYTTFQIIWRLWKAKIAKRILFLVDRNILADQTLVNDFKPFGSVMTKIKNRHIDPAYEVYLGLYQALTGTEEKDKIFKQVSPDFFDLIVIDECHRGSAADDSAWREILDYFHSARQLGLTATPKETQYASNINYFGEPVYTYSLKQGINDGFLAPYKVVRIDIDKDIEGWTPSAGMVDKAGNLIESRLYNQSDMDKKLVLEPRTQLVAQRVMQFLKATDPYAKTIIFCEDVDHAERMRQAVVNAAGQLALDNDKYVMRITGDSKEGKAQLDNFIDPESTYPVIATTSELLSTGVDAKTCKLIVLDKTIRSMTMFKQIVGRGTRIEEQHKKFYFTIMDFKKATILFRDDEFDEDPLVVYEPKSGDSPVPPDPDDIGDFVFEEALQEQVKKYYVDGVEVSILTERVEYMDVDGQLVTESYRDFSRKVIRKEYASLDDFLKNWDAAKKKSEIVKILEEQAILFDALAEEVGKEYGIFDLICHIAYDQPPLTRRERAQQVKKRDYFTQYGEVARQVLHSLLDKYADEGLHSIENIKVLQLAPFTEVGTPIEIIKHFGGKPKYMQAVQELEQALFYR